MIVFDGDLNAKNFHRLFTDVTGHASGYTTATLNYSTMTCAQRRRLTAKRRLTPQRNHYAFPPPSIRSIATHVPPIANPLSAAAAPSSWNNITNELNNRTNNNSDTKSNRLSRRCSCNSPYCVPYRHTTMFNEMPAMSFLIREQQFTDGVGGNCQCGACQSASRRTSHVFSNAVICN